MSEKIKVAELFAGVGGFRLGLDGYDDPSHPEYAMPSAGPFQTVWANQWEPGRKNQFAWRCYEERFGEGSCVNEDINKILDDLESDDDPHGIPDEIDMLVGGFPCFPAGTPVLTAGGYVPIEKISEGDLVFTHEDRFREVIETGSRDNAPLVEVDVRASLPIRCTPEHPFMVRKKDRVWNNSKRTYDTELGDLVQVKACDLTPGEDYVFIPRWTPTEDNPHGITEEEAWLLGRYVADGYTNTSKRTDRKNAFYHTVVYSIGNEKVDAFASRLDEYHATIHPHTAGVHRAIITSKRLCELIDILKLGHGALEKSFSTEVLNLPVSLSTAFLDGYESGDSNALDVEGKYTNRSAVTVSVSLVRMLVLLIGVVRSKVASVSYMKREPTCVIEGREVNQHDCYSVRYREEDYKYVQYYEDEAGWYVYVNGVRELDGTATVFNMNVAEDHTYVVESACVHNCQDYSVAKTLSQAGGIEGKKGVLWWDIYRFLKLRSPKFALFENVDRLLKSPASQRGRDFAIMLSCFASLGYSVEWRVVNAADYGAPQKRKRVYIYAEKDAEWNPSECLLDGIMATALPIKKPEQFDSFDISDDPYAVSNSFGKGDKVSRFQTAGVMSAGHVVTAKAEADYQGDCDTLGDVVVSDSEVPEEFFVPDDELPKWEYQKGSKKLERTTAAGFTYNYSEGAMAYPDLLTNPARTILTSEGGRGASRMKHIIIGDSGRHRRLVPDELDQIQTFPKGWTRGMTDGQRAFCMGNALVVRIVNLIGAEIARRASAE